MSGRARILAIALVLTFGSLSGCSHRPSIVTSRAQGTPYLTATMTYSVPSPTVQRTVTPQPLGMLCQVSLPDTWTSALERGSVSIAGAGIVPFTVAGDTGEAFALLRSPDWAGVAAVKAGSSSYTRIFQFADPENDQVIGGSFDGRWLVWVEGHDAANWDDWTLRAWDSQTNRVIAVTDAPRRNGQPASSGPIVLPVVSHGQLAWVQAAPAGLGEVHLYSLAEQRDRVVSAGQAGPPVVFWWPHLIWQEIDIPGHLGHLAMADAISGRQEALPPVLASIHHLGYISASDALLAWSDGSALWTWRPGDAHPSEIFHAPAGEAIQFVTISGGGAFISWDGIEGPWIADLRSHGAAKLTEHYGGRFANSSSLVVTKPTSLTKSSQPDLHVAIVDITQLPPLPPCPAATPSSP